MDKEEEVKFDCMLRCTISHGGLKFHTSFGEVVGVIGGGRQNTCFNYFIYGWRSVEIIS